MFDGLKKKFSAFVDGLSKKEEKVEEAAEAKEGIKEEIREEAREEANAITEKKEDARPREIPQEKKEEARVWEIPVERKEVTRHEHVQEVSVEHKKEESHEALAKAKQEERKEIHQKIERQEKKPDVTFITKVKGTILGRVKVSDRDADPFLDELKIALLETDVNYDVADRIVDALHKNLVGKELETRDIARGVRQEIRNTLLQILSKNNGIDVLKLAAERKSRGETPVKILFIGPNGAGKTTTIAKMASMFSSNGIRCVISASDTFRAAAIEQSEIHAKRLGVDVIKGRYGADPASIAFDAVAYAKAHGIDAVLIDTAGRQETNKSLIEELKKMVRVNKPDLCIFIGESIAGNALLDQVKQFNEAAKLDGVILTKLDVDSKGGNTLSILSDTSVPVLYFGMGEGYKDLIPYDSQFIVDNIIPN